MGPARPRSTAKSLQGIHDPVSLFDAYKTAVHVQMQDRLTPDVVRSLLVPSARGPVDAGVDQRFQ